MDKMAFTTGSLSVANGYPVQTQNPACLKGKIKNIEETAKLISDQLSKHKIDFKMLKTEKNTLEQVLKVKNSDIKNTLSNELKRLEDEMKRHFIHQKAESGRIQNQINNLKAEKAALSQTLNGLDNRIFDMENGVGENLRK
ncbi:hypothetical protein IMG5_153420 [Ichthyophthirius multifiliis]|uniref:Uncharacterized protein n=1 Tax=Ichthyophthirius multifiliis TaxID=5932 RepID=G0QYZ9_ICHMU|nr:hypothetical protein IMG5_153420 [Ichthyophthirius multifiliis]EGR29570.1 hypothetical protein IMG5_153420 [Ichthyophthirius multifiliis]|eukprot:XP_004030806.1 hypothetical protein IMG5_153420 [Ichthyophthirius multifiliis]